MINSFYVLLGLNLSESLFHAECSVKWTMAAYCPDVQTKIVDQMNAWDNEDCGTKPGDTEPNGQKCLYHFLGNNGLSTNGTHTTPIHRYVDNLLFKFVPWQIAGAMGCLVDAYSQSTPESILDYGTNYCNLFNLMDGSGLAQQTLTEETNDAICTQRSIADCDKF